MKKNKLYRLSILVLVIMLAAVGYGLSGIQNNNENVTTNASSLPRFTSEEELVTAFTEGRNQGYQGYYFKGGLEADMAPAAAPEAAAGGGKPMASLTPILMSKWLV